MICVTTRFRVRHAWLLIPLYLRYQGLRRDLALAPGLIRYAFLVQSPVACCTVSIWESEEALVAFSNVRGHIQAVRWAKRWCRDIWSAYWHVDAVSAYAHEWRGQGTGRGQWPVLLPHPEYSWRLVERPQAEVAHR
jgi:hypothetical protein